MRKSKFDPLVDEFELIDANPNYAHIRFPDGRENTVALKHLAPKNDQEARKNSQAQKHLSNDSNEPSVPSTKLQIANNESDHLIKLLRHHYDAHYGSGAHLTNISL